MYATPADMITRYSPDALLQVTDPEGEALHEEVLSAALADAADEIDGYLAARYTLPLAQRPKVLTLLSCSIAMYRLLSLRTLGDVEDARKRYEDAIAFLRDVANGKIGLGVSETGLAPPTSPGGVAIHTTPSRFGDDQMQGF